jgi:murein DD-endopeptidase MepM/ murein hydrolase activator NlpD
VTYREYGPQRQRFAIFCVSHAFILKTMRWLTFLTVLAAYGADVSLTVRQGEVMKLNGDAASARMEGRTVRLFPQSGGGTLGLMPVPVEQKPGQYTIEWLDTKGSVLRTSAVIVRDAHYKTQNIVIAKAIAELTPSPGESETTSAFRKHVSDIRYWAEPFEAPLPGCLTSPFGVRRLHNGKPTGDYHAGVDQRGAAGAPIHAIAAGVVRIVHQYNLHGGTVAIDHGQGLSSIYLHQSKFAVVEGQQVKRGDIIGYVGSTGRSTAPHLHWSIYANGVPVNPGQWIKLVACSAAKPSKAKRKIAR